MRRLPCQPRPKRLLACGSAALCLLLGWAGAAAAQSQESNTQEATTARPPGTAAVTYVTLNTVYVDAGRSAGLAEGDTLQVLRDASPIATLRVDHLSSRRAACTLLSADATLRAGDAIHFTPHARPSAGPATESPASGAAVAAPRVVSSPEALPWTRRSALRGRVGLQYLSVRDRSGTGADLSRPSLNARVDGRGLGGGSWDVHADLRAHQTSRRPDGGSWSHDTATRVYRLNLGWHPAAAPLQVVAGRQYSPALSAISLFDGISAELGRGRWRAGALTGTQPDPLDYGFDSSIREHGGYVRFDRSEAGSPLLDTTLGVIGSYDHGQVNREFAYVQARWSSSRLSAYGTQEVDVNRGWRKDAEGKTLSPTSSYLTVRVRANRVLSVHAGLDNRRQVRLYRDRETPVTEFDDTYRQGVWGGVDLRLARRYDLGLTLRRRDGASTSSADAVTLRVGAMGLLDRQLRVYGRSTWYNNELVTGWMGSLDASGALGRQLYAGLHGGHRAEASRLSPFFDDTSSWAGADLDISLGEPWYLRLSFERYQGGADANDQLYSTVSYRF